MPVILPLCTLLLPSFIFFTLPIRAEAAATNDDDNYPYFTGGIVSISKDVRGSKVVDDQALNVTDYYHIHTDYADAAKAHSKDILFIFYVVLVTDENGYTDFVDAGPYGNITAGIVRWSGYSSSYWVPQTPGEYTVRTFLVSGFDNPQSLSTVATSQVKVKEKIDMLGEGQSNSRLQVENVDLADNSVKISYNFCDESHPYSHRTEATLHLGDHVSINSVNAYLLSIQDDEKAIIKFVANGGSDICLI